MASHESESRPPVETGEPASLEHDEPAKHGSRPPSEGTRLDLARRLLVQAAVPTIYLLAASWRIKTEGWIERAERGGWLFAFWHQRMLPFLFAHRHQQARILISEHRDGQVIASIAESFGFHTIRGSTTRGGARALVALIREARRSDRDIAITPDGPRGPRHKVQPGIIALARSSGRPIVPATASADRAWWFGSWDRFMLPRPFARIHIRFGEPYSVPREAEGPEGVEACRVEFERRLVALTHEMDDLAKPPWVRAAAARARGGNTR